MHIKRGLFCFLTLALAAFPAFAGNGHMLHGFGPVNSSMAGAGVALYTDAVGAIMFNPALVTQQDGNEVAIGTEIFEDDIGIEVQLDGGNGGRSGITDASSQPGVLPSIAWTTSQTATTTPGVSSPTACPIRPRRPTLKTCFSVRP